MHTGKFLQFLPQDEVYVYFRYNDKERVMVVLNNSETAKEINLARFTEGMKGATKGVDIISEKNIVFSETLEIPGKKAMIIDLKL